MYNFAITGASSGIGQALFNHVILKGHTATNFSRFTEFDLLTHKGLLKLFDIIEYGTFNVFVNNADVKWNSVDILYEIANLWKDNPEKIIVNIGSMSSETVHHQPRPYPARKKAADLAVMQLQNSRDTKCKIINIRPGYVDTPRVAKVTDPKIDTSKVVEIIMWAIEQSESVYVREIKFTPFD